MPTQPCLMDHRGCQLAVGSLNVSREATPTCDSVYGLSFFSVATQEGTLFGDRRRRKR